MSPKRLLLAVVVGLSVGFGAVVAGASPETADPFAFFAPWVSLRSSERQALDRGEVLARALPADDGHLAIFAATGLDATPEAFLAWARRMERVKAGKYVDAIGRLSTPPTLADFARLDLDAGDLDALRECRPGRCAVKLSGDDISALRYAIDRGGASWREAARREFRRVLLARVERYVQAGLAGLPEYADHSVPVAPAAAFNGVLLRSPFLARGLPALASDLAEGPQGSGGADSYLYWSKERYGAGKSVISVSHVRISRPGLPGTPMIVMTSQQVFASHYSSAGLGFTAFLCAAEADCYLAYVNRTQVDVLGGVFGGLKRAVMEQRIRADAPRVLIEMRARIQSGPPQ